MYLVAHALHWSSGLLQVKIAINKIIKVFGIKF